MLTNSRKRQGRINILSKNTIKRSNDYVAEPADIDKNLDEEAFQPTTSGVPRKKRFYRCAEIIDRLRDNDLADVDHLTCLVEHCRRRFKEFLTLAFHLSYSHVGAHPSRPLRGVQACLLCGKLCPYGSALSMHAVLTHRDVSERHASEMRAISRQSNDCCLAASRERMQILNRQCEALNSPEEKTTTERTVVNDKFIIRTESDELRKLAAQRREHRLAEESFSMPGISMKSEPDEDIQMPEIEQIKRETELYENEVLTEMIEGVAPSADASRISDPGKVVSEPYALPSGGSLQYVQNQYRVLSERGLTTPDAAVVEKLGQHSSSPTNDSANLDVPSTPTPSLDDCYGNFEFGCYKRIKLELPDDRVRVKLPRTFPETLSNAAHKAFDSNSNGDGSTLQPYSMQNHQESGRRKSLDRTVLDNNNPLEYNPGKSRRNVCRVCHVVPQYDPLLVKSEEECSESK